MLFRSWLPAGLERSAIQLHNVAGPGYFDFHNYFVTLRELFSPSLYFDLGATEPKFQHNLGLAQWVLAALGALTVAVPRLRRTDTIFFTFAAIIFVYVITQASVNFWEAIPLMSFFQFPTRFLGPAALAFAPLAGNAVRWVESLQRPRPVALAGAIALGGLFLAAMPLTHPPEWRYFGPVTRLRMIGVELQGRALGTTSANDFLPVGVAMVPKADPAMLASYKNGGPIDRVNHPTLPEGAAVTLDQQKSLYDRYTVNSPTDFVFRSFTFDFPGWKARVDGQPQPIFRANFHFRGVFLEPGRHKVVFTYQPWQFRFGMRVSLLTTVILLSLLWLRYRRGLTAFRRRRVPGDGIP